jgi:hypothetical protein
VPAREAATAARRPFALKALTRRLTAHALAGRFRAASADAAAALALTAEGSDEQEEFGALSAILAPLADAEAHKGAADGEARAGNDPAALAAYDAAVDVQPN